MENNFLQVGKAIACGHCDPETFGDGLKAALASVPDFKCDCECHIRKEIEELLAVVGHGERLTHELARLFDRYSQERIRQERGRVRREAGQESTEVGECDGRFINLDDLARILTPSQSEQAD